jgi:hypothetical protein
MSSQSNPNFSEEDARTRAAEVAFPDTEARRPRAHGRKNSLAHHRSQEHEVHGGRTAARQQNTTDSSRGRGRAVSIHALEILGPDYGDPGEHPDAIARSFDPYRATPLPPDHPEVLKEIKFARIAALLQPGSNDEVDQKLSGGIKGYDDDDDWIA